MSVHFNTRVKHVVNTDQSEKSCNCKFFGVSWISEINSIGLIWCRLLTRTEIVASLLFLNLWLKKLSMHNSFLNEWMTGARDTTLLGRCKSI